MEIQMSCLTHCDGGWPEDDVTTKWSKATIELTRGLAALAVAGFGVYHLVSGSLTGKAVDNLGAMALIVSVVGAAGAVGFFISAKRARAAQAALSSQPG